MPRAGGVGLLSDHICLLMAILVALTQNCDLYENFRFQGEQVWNFFFQSQRVYLPFNTRQNGYRASSSARQNKTPACTHLLTLTLEKSAQSHSMFIEEQETRFSQYDAI